jgi:inositol transport system substrate-binding protein
MFCSEFVANTLNNGNIVNFDNPSSVHPVDFLNIDGIECIYEGKLKDIPQKIIT